MNDRSIPGGVDCVVASRKIGLLVDVVGAVALAWALTGTVGVGGFVGAERRPRSRRTRMVVRATTATPPVRDKRSRSKRSSRKRLATALRIQVRFGVSVSR